MYSEARNRFFETQRHFSIPRIHFQDHQNNFEKSFKIITLIFTVFYLQKGLKRAKIGSFLDLFFAIFSILGHDIKNRSQGRNNLPKYYKKHYKCQGFTPVTFEKIAKNTSKKQKTAPNRTYRGGGLVKIIFGVHHGVPQMTPLCQLNQSSHKEHKSILQRVNISLSFL